MIKIGTKFVSPNGSMFTVFGFDGDSGYKIYCEHGSWSCTYDHDLKMAMDFFEGQEDRNCYSPSIPKGIRHMNLKLKS